MSSSAKKKAKPTGKKSATPKKAKVAKTKKIVKEAAPEEEKPKKVAPKAKKAVEKKEAPAKPVVKAKKPDLGPPPSAIIVARRVDSLRERAARGFSFGELSSAGVPVNSAKREGVSLDIRRRTVLDGNVEALRGWFKSQGGASGKPVEPVAIVATGKKK
jgi:ribosomal protein L13E